MVVCAKKFYNTEIFYENCSVNMRIGTWITHGKLLFTYTVPNKGQCAIFPQAKSVDTKLEVSDHEIMTHDKLNQINII